LDLLILIVELFLTDPKITSTLDIESLNIIKQILQQILLNIKSNYELMSSDIQIQGKLGEGSYGVVHAGILSIC
jgi:hypothetical protein